LGTQGKGKAITKLGEKKKKKKGEWRTRPGGGEKKGKAIGYPHCGEKRTLPPEQTGRKKGGKKSWEGEPFLPLKVVGKERKRRKLRDPREGERTKKPSLRGKGKNLSKAEVPLPIGGKGHRKLPIKGRSSFKPPKHLLGKAAVPFLERGKKKKKKKNKCSTLGTRKKVFPGSMGGGRETKEEAR